MQRHIEQALLSQYGHAIYQWKGNVMLNTIINDLELLEFYSRIFYSCLCSTGNDTYL